MTDSQKLDCILSEMQGMKADIQGMKAEIQGMKADIQGMKAEMQDMKTEIQSVKDRVAGIELHLENITDWNIRLLAENHLALVDKLNAAVRVSDKTTLYEIQVRILTEKVNVLSKEVVDLKRKIA